MKNSVKLISVLMAIMLLFCGCTSSGFLGGKSSTALTTENASDYLTFSLHGGGGDPDYSSTYGIVYHSVEVNGDISGISGYEYNDVSIVLKFSFKLTSSDGTDNGTYELTTEAIPLNVGGNGIVNVSESNREEAYFTTSFYESNIECLGYEIVSVTGSVKPA